MSDTMSRARQAADVLYGTAEAALPIWLAGEATLEADMGALTPAQRQWLRATGFKGAARRHALVPAGDGSLAGVVLGTGAPAKDARSDPAALYLGLLPTVLPPGTYSLASPVSDPVLAAVAWGLGAYRFERYKSKPGDPLPRLAITDAGQRAAALAIVEAVWLGRDLINTPASDMGPAELEAAARALAAVHGAIAHAIVGDDLLTENFPMIHAVGRASSRPPRLIDLTWGRADARKVTLVGKGICFDTGGLDIKPSSGMLLMKKDMGGAAVALTLGAMIMAAGLDVRLRILIPAAENSISGNAFRPSDVLTSRAGRTVEVGNTDAEGRLVLADALDLADAEAPDTLLCFATLTGAARVALGPDLPAMFTGDDALAAALAEAGGAVGDPIWRLPLETPYESWLDSPVADMGNVSEGGFAGAIVAAMFLKRFVSRARRFAHFDLYGWRASAKPLGPKGGETQVARAAFELLRREMEKA
jgi:leucyl aminopeptidase